ncbi:DUF4124 domain-containing protein [methanotrophic endosymbiont of Bathymodiolus puteoserpentis (Logatchev)]|jgi:hypothetical protein|uniref:DUF4124 domain-containing protein n=1 Tax=methanotrophic endosymbiont of Bathymodiolus puteoserpentis (Logatchev) TaxID=343235 RepID=UPI0013C6C8A4|nr:DUF4124 domain-containing protein [methanotrophic endosymbiont of Bathymodiolus puteoserpentis (Logatchev)]SHE20839.1 hypothetical protein BPUTEOMOX_760 [methanotrophic endosymbiont of Bathymodiolus puteoserpentis (Logatchev)]
MNYRRVFFCSIVLASYIAVPSLVAAKMYRWVDSNGNIYYSDKVPPQQSKLARKVLNQQGRVIKTIGAAKTDEQFALEKRLKLLRQEQEKIIAKQKSNDKVLLSTFRNIDDLRLTLKGKLSSVNAHKLMLEAALVSLNDTLSSARNRAAQAERKGQRVPVAILKLISDTEDEINSTYEQIAKVEKQYQEIQRKFDKDIERFIFLTQGSRANTQTLIDETAETQAANVLGLFNCFDHKTCDQAWEIARQFVNLYSTTPINFNTNTLIMSSDPMIGSDLSLSVSKSKRANNKTSIFLDIRCHHSTRGAELCKSERVNHIRHSFMSYIESKLPKK